MYDEFPTPELPPAGFWVYSAAVVVVVVAALFLASLSSGIDAVDENARAGAIQEFSRDLDDIHDYILRMDASYEVSACERTEADELAFLSVFAQGASSAVHLRGEDAASFAAAFNDALWPVSNHADRVAILLFDGDVVSVSFFDSGCFTSEAMLDRQTLDRVLAASVGRLD